MGTTPEQTNQIVGPQVIESAALPTQVVGPIVNLTEPTLDTPWGPLAVPQPIYDKWQALAAENTSDGGSVQLYLGFALQLVTFASGTGTAAYFERGMIVLRPDRQTFVVYGAIYQHYRELGDVNPSGWSPGLPVSDEEAVSGGRRSRFDGADIYWSPGSGAHEVHGAIRDHWESLGGVGSFLGFPLTDESSVTDGGTEIGRMNLFQGGSIYWSPASGAWEVHGALRQAWLERYGGPTGSLGWPVSDETGSPSGAYRFNDFQNGCLTWSSSTGAIQSFTAIDVYVDRVSSKGCHTFWECHGFADVWVYVNCHVWTNLGQDVSPRLPSTDHYGPNASPTASLLTIDPVRGGLVVAVDFDGWDACESTSDQHLGEVTNSFDIETLWGTNQPQEIWNGDFFIAYAVRNQTPADPMDPNYRQDLFWGFKNFNTAALSRAQYGQTFVDVQGDESGWTHPFDELFYDLVYRGLAANGNCFGMCLEANYALARRSLYSEPINGVSGDGTAMNEMNIKHGYQIGAGVIDYVVGKFLTGGTHDPVRAFNESRDMYESGDYPIISLMKDYLGGDGHAVRPYRWDQSNPADWVIYVANPNETAAMEPDDNPNNVIHVDPNANTFRFTFDDGTVWSGGTWTGGRMFALPFSVMCEEPRTPFWEVFALLAAGTLILLGGTGQTRQITDGSSRPFYDPSLSAPPTLWEHLAPDGARIPDMARISLIARQFEGAVAPQAVGGEALAGLGEVVAPAIPEIYYLRGSTPPFGVPPTQIKSPAVGRFLGVAPVMGQSPSAEPAASPEVTTALANAELMAHPELDQALPPGASLLVSPGQLVHEIVALGSGDYQWGMRSAGASALAVVPSAGDGAKVDSVTVSKPGAADQAVALTLAPDGPARQAQVTLVSSAASDPDQVRVFTLTNVALQPGQPFTAQLSPGAQEIHLTNPGPTVTFDLEVRTGGLGGAVASRPSVTVEGGKVAVIRPADWTPAAMPTAAITMQIKDQIDGPVIQEVTL